MVLLSSRHFGSPLFLLLRLVSSSLEVRFHSVSFLELLVVDGDISSGLSLASILSIA